MPRAATRSGGHPVGIGSVDTAPDADDLRQRGFVVVVVREARDQQVVARSSR